jgi:hypothetical protein
MDDPETREDRWKSDKFAACQEIYEEFNDGCSQAVQMGAYGAIDECLYACRNSISFKQYNPSKPAKYGLLFKQITDVEVPFTHRSEVFAGRPHQEGNTPYYINTTEAIVHRLINEVAKHQDLTGVTKNLRTVFKFLTIHIKNETGGFANIMNSRS